MKTVSAIKAKFLRSKISTRDTKLWKDFDEFVKKNITKHLQLNTSESIVLCFWANEDYWWTITNERLIISEKQSIGYFPLLEISKVELQELFSGEATKYDNTNIDIHTKEKVIKMKVEKGTWPIVYEIMKFVVS